MYTGSTLDIRFSALIGVTKGLTFPEYSVQCYVNQTAVDENRLWCMSLVQHAVSLDRLSLNTHRKQTQHADDAF